MRLRLDLRSDQADPARIDEEIRGGVDVRGTNLWLLFFAIVIASIGLNVNSTAVIIGAMLISPLMGPLLGVGYGAAVGDFGLVRRSLLNLGVATMVSLVASAAYFWITPLSQAHSELLARTSPTLWDVLIATFGGLAGIVGSTRRERSNVLPGVAIATALMPPLCTAGFGLATGAWTWFAGAFYLFFINSVFIAAATFVMVRLLGLPELPRTDPVASRRAHRWILLLAAGTALPSLLLAQRLVAQELFTARADRFLAAAFPLDGDSFVVDRVVSVDRQHIRVTVVGEPVPQERREALAALLPAYDLGGASLSVLQTEQPVLDVAALRDDIGRDLIQRTLLELQARDVTIAELQRSLQVAKAAQDDAETLEAEARALVPAARRVVVTRRPGSDPRAVAIVLEQDGPVSDDDAARLRAWLQARTGAVDAWVFAVPPPAEVLDAPVPGG